MGAKNLSFTAKVIPSIEVPGAAKLTFTGAATRAASFCVRAKSRLSTYCFVTACIAELGSWNNVKKPAVIESPVFNNLSEPVTLASLRAMRFSNLPKAVRIESVAVTAPPEAVLKPVNALAITAALLSVTANDPVPVPVASPVSVIVWSPVFVPLRFVAAKLPEASRFAIVFAAAEVEAFNVRTGVVVWLATLISVLAEVTEPTLPPPVPNSMTAEPS